MGFICACMLQLCLTLCDPWTIAKQAPLSIEFSRQKYWSGLPFSTPGDLPDPGFKPASLPSPALAGIFFTNWKPQEWDEGPYKRDSGKLTHPLNM